MLVDDFNEMFNGNILHVSTKPVVSRGINPKHDLYATFAITAITVQYLVMIDLAITGPVRMFPIPLRIIYDPDSCHSSS